VIVFDINIIKNAIMREINRGVVRFFFVHNNVQTIAALCQKLSRLLPGVSIAFAHGQMNERDLEKIMSAFNYNQISILSNHPLSKRGSI
jgi:transcription-repair coupling factor (superfamily II helicase)